MSARLGRRGVQMVAVMLLTFGGLSAVAATPASASSTVHVTGSAGCNYLGGMHVRAYSVTIRLDFNGQSRTGYPNYLSNYGMDFTSMPRGGTWATATVKCRNGALQSSYKKRAFLKPGTFNRVQWNLKNW